MTDDAAASAITLLNAPWAAIGFGPFAGSVAGVLAQRLPQGRPVGLARSRCDACGRVLSPTELVPVLSWLALRGRCRGCRAPIGLAPLAIELAATAVAGWAAWAAPPGMLWPGCLLGWTLLTLAWIDLRAMLLPDLLTLPLLLAGLAAAALLQPETLFDRAVGALAGFALLEAVRRGYRRLRGREGLGDGDPRLLAAGGAWLGWQALGGVLLGAALLGLAGAALARLAGRRVGRDTRLPFGPCLAASIWLAWLYGPF